ncbi:MAG TPA: phosphopantetheine-binding protein, partial [Pyrinomonadaceae bacterium]
VREACVVARGEGAGRRLVAYLAGGGVGGAEARRRLAEELPGYMVPQAFVEVEALPLTPNGKVDRARLPEPGGGRPDVAQEYAPPRNPVEAQMAHIWQEVLRLEQVGIDDNFFELGGHSLLATQLTSRLRDSFEVELPLRNIFESPTIAELSLTIERALRTQQTRLEPIKPVETPEELLLAKLDELSDEELDSMLPGLLAEEGAD